MKAYIGQTRSASLVARLQQLGYGEMTVRGELPAYRTPYAFDNGVYRDWTADVPWTGGIPMKDGEPQRKSPIYPERDWVADVNWLEENLLGGGIEGQVVQPPDFIVAPDKVMGGLDSLRMSAEFAYQLRAIDWDEVALAVQDGMTSTDVDRYRNLFSTIFVGGSLDWKIKTGAQWVEYAHRHGMRCHVGRVGTVDRVLWAKRIGADSIDSAFPLWKTSRLDDFVNAMNGTLPQQSLFGE